MLVKTVLRERRSERERRCDLVLNNTESFGAARQRPPRLCPHSVSRTTGCRGSLRKPRPKCSWRFSLTGDRLLLSEAKTSGVWGPGVLLSEEPPGEPSVTSRVAHWAARTPERGEPGALQ